MPSGRDQERVPEDLAAFIRDLEFSDLSEEAVSTSEQAITDTIGVMLAGTATKTAQAVADFVDSTSGTDGPGPIFTSGNRASLSDAVLANGVAAHALDFDDDQFTIYSHTSATMLPTMFTLLEKYDISGPDIVTAHVAGFEAQYYFASPLNPSHYEHGWHSTATFGVFGTAAAIASLFCLNKEEIQHALNIAASKAAGLKKNFGTPTKPLHVGHTARSGFTAAMLASKGFTANLNTLTDRQGFFELYAGSGGVDFDNLHEPGIPCALATEGLHKKKYPCCFAAHKAIAAAVELAEKENINSNEIEGIHIYAPQISVDSLPYNNPTTGLEAKFSMEYCIAAALSKDKITIETFEDNAIDDTETQSLRKQITVETDESLPYDGNRNTVLIQTDNGETYKHRRFKTPGSPADPLSEFELREKFELCMSRITSDSGKISEAYSRLSSISKEPRGTDIVKTLIL